MAYLKQTKTEEEIKKLSVSLVRRAYNELAIDYNKIVEGNVLLCHACNEFIARTNFYTSNSYATGVYPECKKCLRMEFEQRKKKSDPPRETKESFQKVLKKMNLPYIDSLYEAQCKSVEDRVNEHNRNSPGVQYLTVIKSLPNWKGKTWEDSEFEDTHFSLVEETEVNENSRILKSARRNFGNYPPQDLMFLETEYKDWTERYPCENKAQEVLFKRICFKQLDIDKAQKNGEDTKELDKSLQDLLTSMNLKPSQKNTNSLTEAKTFGQLIKLWEDEKPIPEPDPEFKDVDNIGLYIDVFFKGHLSKMMGLKNGFSRLYEKFMAKYTVKKPEYEEDSDSEALFDKIFGEKLDNE